MHEIVVRLACATLLLAVSAALVQGLMLVLRPSSAGVRQCAWFFVLLQGIVLFHLPIRVPWYDPLPDGGLGGELQDVRRLSAETPPEAEPIAAEVTGSASAAPVIRATWASRLAQAATLLDWSTVSAALWLSGMAGLVIFSGLSYVLLLRRIAQGRPAPPDWAEELRELLRERRIVRAISLLVTRNIGPALCWKPWGYRVCVPGPSWAKLASSQRRQVLRHELAHFERADLWKLLLVRLLALPHWFNPFAWWAVHQIAQSAEWACDQEATGRKPERAVEFAKALVQLGVASSLGVCPAKAAGRSSLFVRIRRLMVLKSLEDSRMKKVLILTAAAGLVAVNLVRIELVAKEPEGDTPSGGVGIGAGVPPLKAAPADSGVPQVVKGTGKHGDSLFTIDIRFVRGSAEDLKRPDANWNVMPPWPADPANRLEVARPNRAQVVIEKNLPVMIEILDENRAEKAIERWQGHRKVSILAGPKIALFDGQAASISDASPSPFVVGLKEGKPQIRAFSEGIEMHVVPQEGPEGKIRLEVAMKLSKIRKVETVEVPGPAGGKPVTLQIPEVETAQVDTGVEFSPGQWLLIGALQSQNEKGKPEAVQIMMRARKAETQGNSGKPVLAIRIVGNTIFSEACLRTQTNMPQNLSVGFDGAQIDEATKKKIDADLDRLTAYYRCRGFFGVRVGRVLEFNEEQNRLVLTFVIDEGPRYSVRNVSFTGNTKFTADELRKELKLKGGQFFDQDQMTADIKTIREKYGIIGYMSADVKADVQFLDQHGQIDMIYTISEGTCWQPNPEQAKSIAEIEKLGGKVTFSEPSPGKSVSRVSVRFRQSGTTNASLAYLKGLPEIESVSLQSTWVNDEGLAQLEGLTTLKQLSLGQLVTDRGLAHLSGLSNLEHLYLAATRITDAGLAHLSGLSNLEHLYLAETRITDAGLRHLRSLTNLRVLCVEGTGITDAGLAHLVAMPNLEEVHLFGTKVSEDGVKRLQGASRRLRIVRAGEDVSRFTVHL